MVGCHKNKIRITKPNLKTDDGCETTLPRRFFANAAMDIVSFSVGDFIQMRKIGFDDELDQTIWAIVGLWFDVETEENTTEPATTRPHQISCGLMLIIRSCNADMLVPTIEPQVSTI